MASTQQDRITLPAPGLILATDFGVDWTGANDSTAAIQNAINAAAAQGGGIVQLPPGTMLIAGTINITGNTSSGGITLQGAGMNATVLNFANGSLDCITIQGGGETAQLYGCRLRDMRLNHTGKTGGRSLYVAYSDNMVIENIEVISPWNMFELYVTNNVVIRNIWNEQITGGVGTRGLYWHAPGDGSGPRSDYLALEDFVVNAQYSGADGIVIDGISATLVMTRGNLLGVRYGVQVNNTSASAENLPNYLNFTDVNSEGASICMVQLNSGNDIKMDGCIWMNGTGETGQGSADTNAVQINYDPVGFNRDISISNCTIGGCRQTALYVKCQGNVRITNNSFPSWPGTVANTYAAIVIDTPTSDVIITGNWTEFFGAPQTWKYGLQVNAGVTNLLESNNDFRLSETKEVLWLATDSQSISGADITSSEAGIIGAPQAQPQGVTVTGNFELTAQQMLNVVCALGGTAGAVTVSTPTAVQLVAGMPSPSYDKLVDLFIINGTNGTVTLGGNTGVTFTGNTSAPDTFTIAQNTSRTFKLSFLNTVPGSEAVTMWG